MPLWRFPFFCFKFKKIIIWSVFSILIFLFYKKMFLSLRCLFDDYAKWNSHIAEPFLQRTFWMLVILADSFLYPESEGQFFSVFFLSWEWDKFYYSQFISSCVEIYSISSVMRFMTGREYERLFSWKGVVCIVVGVITRKVRLWELCRWNKSGN